MARSVPLIDRFAVRVALAETGCLLWTGARNEWGYGIFGVNRSSVLAHRWYYTQVVGPIPQGLELDHLCRVRHCVLPAHLEAVSHSKNLARGDMSRRADPALCKAGLHAWTEPNIYRCSDGRARCHPCKLESGRLYRERKK